MAEVKKELGMKPYGLMDSYTSTVLSSFAAGQLNSREKESVDVHWCKLQATWQRLWDLGQGPG